MTYTQTITAGIQAMTRQMTAEGRDIPTAADWKHAERVTCSLQVEADLITAATYFERVGETYSQVA